MSDPDSLLIAVGLRILKARRTMGLNRPAMAVRAGIAFQTFTRAEDGTQNITVRTLCCIADALGVEVTSLLPDRDGHIESEPVNTTKLLIAECGRARSLTRRISALIDRIPSNRSDQ